MDIFEIIQQKKESEKAMEKINKEISDIFEVSLHSITISVGIRKIYITASSSGDKKYSQEFFEELCKYFNKETWNFIVRNSQIKVTLGDNDEESLPKS